MDASIPARAGDGNGDDAARFGQALLDAALADGRGRVALLTIEGVDRDIAAGAAAAVLRRADATSALKDGRLAILAPHLREIGGAADLAARVLAALPPAAAAEASIGIAIAPDDGVLLGDLAGVAGMAAGRARRYAVGRFAFPDVERDRRWRIGPLLAGAIAEALAHDEFRLVYQPICRLADGAPAGAEALLRWTRRGGEVWPPALFIAEAERRGLMEPVTAWTFTAASAMAASLAPPPGFRIGVNLSATMLGHGAAEMAGAILEETGCDAARLTVEITETAPFMDEPDALADVEALARLGLGIAIDDFGAGHASLAYAVRLPASRIKLDASLTQAFLKDPRARAAVRAAAGLARDLGADVVAEGVDAPELAAALASSGVVLGQGALFGAAVPGPPKLDRDGPGA